MRLSHCESHCAAPLRYIPCLPKPRDASGDSASPPPLPAAVATAEEEPPIIQRIEVAVLAGKDDDEEDEKREDATIATAAAAAPTKSNLKKADCDESKCATKGNVKWLDLLGKDLTEVKEFEPSECGDSLDDGDGIAACVCVIQ